jgi:uncharacterized protein YjdB
MLTVVLLTFGITEPYHNPNNPRAPAYVLAEHAALQTTFPVAKFPKVASRDGRWDAPATWEPNGVPTAEDRVLIPTGFTVTIDSTTAACKVIRVDGTLRFSRDLDTKFIADTIIGPLCGSTLDVGIQTDPVLAKCEVIFRDAGPIDILEDPREFGHGYVGHRTLIWGKAKDSQADFVSAPVGATSITCLVAPKGWEVGDTLILLGWQKVTVTGVNDKVVSFTPALTKASGPLTHDKSFAMNLTRNIVFRSETPGYGGAGYQPGTSLGDVPPAIVKARGHFMVMGCGVGESQIGYAAFNDLGRTDKRLGLDAVKFKDGKRVEVLNGKTSGDNQVGRYALHFHHGGRLGNPAIVQGCSVSGSPGWGFTNHSSNVLFDRCVGYDCIGAIFSSEIGDEVGEYRDCAGLRADGGHAGTDGIVNNADMDREQGTAGTVFWSQTAGRMKYVRCRGFNTKDFAIAFWSGPGTQVYSSNPNRGLDNIFGFIDPLDIDPAGPDAYLLDLVDPATGTINPQVSSINVEGGAFERINIGPNPASYKHPGSFRGVHVYGGIQSNYSINQRFEDCTMIGGSTTTAPPYNPAFRANGGDSHSFTFERCTFHKWSVLWQGVSMGINQYIDCVGTGGMVEAGGNGWTNISQVPLRPREVWLKNYPIGPFGFKWSGEDSLIMNRIIYDGKQLYGPKSEPDFVPYTVANDANYPGYYVGKTNAQLLTEYGVAVCGDVTPTDAVADPKFVGFKSGPVSKRPAVVIRDGYQGVSSSLSVKRASGAIVKLPVEVYLPKQSPPVMLNIEHPVKPGWQAVPFEFDGQKLSVNVFGTGTTEPPVPNPPVVTTVIVTPVDVVLEVGKTVQLSALVKDQFGNTMAGKAVTWLSANAPVAAVSASGLVSAIGVGNASIQATCEGKSASSTITVIPIPLVVTTVEVTPATVTLEVGKTAQLTAVVKDQFGNAMPGKVVVWSASNATVAAVSATGLVSANTAGSATISASCESKANAANVTVTSPPPAKTIKKLTIEYSDGTKVELP